MANGDQTIFVVGHVGPVLLKFGKYCSYSGTVLVYLFLFNLYLPMIPSSFSVFFFIISHPLLLTVMQLSPREKAAINYNQKLKEKFKHHPQIRRISHHRHLPKNLYHQTNELRIMKEARRRKYVFTVSTSACPQHFAVGGGG